MPTRGKCGMRQGGPIKPIALNSFVQLYRDIARSLGQSRSSDFWFMIVNSVPLPAAVRTSPTSQHSGRLPLSPAPPYPTGFADISKVRWHTHTRGWGVETVEKESVNKGSVSPLEGNRKPETNLGASWSWKNWKGNR